MGDRDRRLCVLGFSVNWRIDSSEGSAPDEAVAASVSEWCLDFGVGGSEFGIYSLTLAATSANLLPMRLVE